MLYSGATVDALTRSNAVRRLYNWTILDACPTFFFLSSMPALTDNDPPPTPPIEPQLEDCCQSGCDPCIFDIYQDALERYRLALKEWQARRDAAARKQ
ncbi:oxidoreductase-like domain-containing protein [Herbaspirillum sp. meg3]|uniref:oxidoreductase-like domain-containing protein n=1 Tax=Herbaspirillum sp. meg3 TaxID=2025949 RepID=UPI001E3AF6DA|nr:oxidoreductase-like domain-containing protein [Herbaspirillum sp. meg3]